VFLKKPLPLQLKEAKVVGPAKTDRSQERFKPKEAYLKSAWANSTFSKYPVCTQFSEPKYASFRNTAPLHVRPTPNDACAKSASPTNLVFLKKPLL
jgi:hypothetical protein